jgi:hypothetical protein
MFSFAMWIGGGFLLVWGALLAATIGGCIATEPASQALANRFLLLCTVMFVVLGALVWRVA